MNNTPEVCFPGATSTRSLVSLGILKHIVTISLIANLFLLGEYLHLKTILDLIRLKNNKLEIELAAHWIAR